MKEFLIVLEEIRPVKGYLRSVLYDLPRGEFKFISNKMYNFILKKNRTSIKLMNKIELKFVDFLIKNEYAILVTQDVLRMFPKLNTQWDYPAIISNVILEFEIISWKILDILNKISISGVTVVRIEIKQFVSENNLNLLCEILEQSELRLATIFLNKSKINDNYISLSKKIESIVILNSNVNSEKLTESNFLLMRTTLNKIDFLNKQRKKPYSFNINISLYTESLIYNNYYNKKLYIDSKGTIKNTPEYEKKFGCIQDLKNEKDILKIIESPDFKKYWTVHKEICDICKDCEFRHMCVDNRLPHKRKENEWYHKIECNYNPYVGKWKGDEGYVTLEESGVISNEKEYAINREKIAKINKELWDEDE